MDSVTTQRYKKLVPGNLLKWNLAHAPKFITAEPFLVLERVESMNVDNVSKTSIQLLHANGNVNSFVWYSVDVERREEWFDIVYSPPPSRTNEGNS